MISLTKRTEYALIALHYMIEQGAAADKGSFAKVTPASAREIAERYTLPLPLLMNILKKLAGEHVLVSVRGVKGGYVLCGDPRRLSLADLIEAVEGPVMMVECACENESKLSDGHGAAMSSYPCKLSLTCPIKRPLQMLHAKVMEFLKNTSVYDICSFKDEGSLTQLNTAAMTG